MKKKLMLRNERSSNSILLRIMKITCTLFFVGILQIFAFNAYSQNARVTMNHVNTPLRVILNDIEKQTNYLFVIINSQVDTQKKYTVQVKSEPVSTVLNTLFQGENVVYQLQGNHIVLSREDKKREQKSKRTVTGYIKDHSGEPLVGASMWVWRVRMWQLPIKTVSISLSTMVHNNWTMWLSWDMEPKRR